MNIYEFEDYKSALRSVMAERRNQFGSRFTFERMAEACGVQKTYLSKVLNSSAHLNPDQLFSAGEYLKLNSSETDFLLLLRDNQIALNSKRASALKEKVQKIRNENLKTDSVIEVVPESSIESRKWEYYTDVDLQLVHLFMTVASFAKDPPSICLKIGITEPRLESILLKLQNWRLIQFTEGSYQVKDPKLHLSEDSPVFLAFGILNRIKTLEKLRQLPPLKADNNDYFFSVVFSAEAKFQTKLKRKFLEVLKETQADVIHSKAEQVYQLHIDFFRWS